MRQRLRILARRHPRYRALAALVAGLGFAAALQVGGFTGVAHAAQAIAGTKDAPHQDAKPSAGESIYRRGILPSGEPLVGDRSGGAAARGADAACTNCHRHSGLGSKEGRSLIPPIAGRYLFHPAARTKEDLDLPYVEGMRLDREPYTEATLARAIREGIDSQGRTLSYLMPRYALGDADMATLVDFLKQLDRRHVPGVTGTVLHFATVITPDADPAKRAGMLDVLQHYFADKNAVPLGATPALRSSRKMMFMANRRWELHVWQLTGPASTWEGQLTRHLAQEPVFAVLSGLGGSNWAPVQSFCEHQAIPCLFPNVEAPPTDADRHFYSLYFSKGVLLEAELIANRMLDDDSAPMPKVVEQFYRSGDSGEAAARALASTLQARGVHVSSHAIARGDAPKSVEAALHRATRADALVLWLRAPDIAALGAAPQGHAVVYMSGLMSGLERAPLPAAWRDRTYLAYPVDMPDLRRVRVDYPLGWFSIRRIPVVAEQVQADTYIACGLVSETLSHMADTFVRDYLVERMEDMLEHRILTGYYPRLTLAEGQRFASKGGYVVRFADAEGTRLVAAHDWVVP